MLRVEVLKRQQVEVGYTKADEVVDMAESTAKALAVHKIGVIVKEAKTEDNKLKTEAGPIKTK